MAALLYVALHLLMFLGEDDLFFQQDWKCS